MKKTFLQLLWVFMFFAVGFIALGFFIRHVLEFDQDLKKQYVNWIDID